jgi:two-component system, NarL family, response regulator DevR
LDEEIFIMPKIVNVLVADDHAIVRRGIKALLERQSQFKVVAEAKTGEEAIEMAKEFHPDVAVLDIRMPGVSGIEACRQIVASGEGCKVIILTAYAEDELFFSAIQAGAVGYVLKLVIGNELVYAVEHVSSGEGYVDAAMIKSLFNAVHKASDVRNASHFSVLTSQEMAVLGFVTTGMTNRQIAKQLFLGEGTVRNYVSSVLTKLAVTNRAQAAVFAIEHNIGAFVAANYVRAKAQRNV